MLFHFRPVHHEFMIVEALLHLSPHSYLYCFGCVTNLFQVIRCIFNLSVLEDVIHEAKFHYLGVIFIVFLTEI